MKKLFLLYVIMSELAVSCDKYNSGIADPSIYANVYMPGAERKLITSVTTTAQGGDGVYNVGYSAYLGGSSDAKSDITITFAVNSAAVDSFNTANGTNYRLLPSSNYTLSSLSATIKAGSRSTDSLTLAVKNDAHLSLFKTYVLPIQIVHSEGGGAKIYPPGSTSFYIFTVGTQKVLSLGSDWGGILSVGPKLSVISNLASTYDILLNLPDSNKIYAASPLHIGINWNASESFYYVNENSMVVRNAPPYSGLFNFIMYPNQIIQNNPNPSNGIIVGASNFWLGDQWDAFILAPYNNYFMGAKSNGDLWRIPAYAFWQNVKTFAPPAGAVQIASGFNYTQVLSYPSMNPNALLCVDKDGGLWYYPMSQAGVPGTRTQVGSGWNVFKKIIVVGNDILALNSTNNLYRINFDPTGFIHLD